MWPSFSRECRREVDAVLKGGRLTGYRANAEWGIRPQPWSNAYKFERELEKAFNVKHAIATNSGTAALHAALEGIGVRGREVILPPFTFSATASAVLMAGGIPKFCDVDPHTFCLDQDQARKLVTKKTGAIIHVNLFGFLPDLSRLLESGVPVLEDGAQSVGAKRDGRFSGTLGIAGIGSSNGGKNLPTGEGGFVTTNDSKLAEKARLLTNHSENFGSESVGYNYRMHELVGVLARHGLKELEGRNQRRQELARILATWFFDADRAYAPSVYFPSPLSCRLGDNVFYVLPFILRNMDRSRFISRCAKRGLPVQESYTTPLHHLKAFRKYCDRKLPVVDELHERTLCLLTNLTPDKPLSEARRTAKIIREALE